MEILGLLHVGLLQVESVVSEHSESHIHGKYQDCFTGFGIVKNYELKDRIDESVTPVPQPVHRILLA